MSVKKCDDLSISPWIQRFSHLVPEDRQVLDLAAGGGRHGLWFLEQGHHVTAIDRKINALMVVDENGLVQGALNMHDLLRAGVV